MGCGGSTQAEPAQNNTQKQQPPPAAAKQAAPAPAASSGAIFTAAEEAELKNRFATISKLNSDDGLIDEGEFMKILKFEDSLFVKRMFSMFDRDSSKGITQDEFMKGLAILHPKGSYIEKVKLAFRMWDLNGDNIIQKSELLSLTKSSLAQSSLLISEDQISKLIDSTFALADNDNSGGITEAEFKGLVDKYPSMIANMTLEFNLSGAQ